MADPTQFTFELREVAEVLVKKAGLTTGLWHIGINFGFGAMNVGPNENDLRPTAIVGVLNFVLTKADKPSGLTIDAAKLSEAGTDPM